MSYLVFPTESEAWARSSHEAKRFNMGATTTHATAPRKTANGKWALPVDGYELTDQESAGVATAVQWPEEPEE